jgi:hypothetical protein
VSDLRERLAAAATPIATWTVEVGQAVSVDKAVTVVAAWLRDEAAELDRQCEESDDWAIRRYIATEAIRVLELADAIDPQPERTTP